MSHRVLSEHRGYLADAVRNEAYEAALAQVCSGAVVLDLGCGTGVWGLVALRHGARHVYAVESTGMIDWAKAVAHANGLADRITYLRGWSKDIDLPELVDVVVSDQLGQFILEGDGVDVLADAARRFLRPGGTLIPARIDYWAALGHSKLVQDELGFWSTRPLGLDVEALSKMAAGTRWYEQIDSAAFVAEPARLVTLDPSEIEGNLIRLAAEQRLDTEGSANALFGWFEAELVPGVWISNGPGTVPRIDRCGVALPLFPDLGWNAGAECVIELVARTGSKVLGWTVRAGGQKRQSSTVAGSLGGIEGLRAERRLNSVGSSTPGAPRSPARHSPAQ